MLEGVAASTIAPRLRHLVHLPFTAWTGLGLLTAGLMWIACRWTSSPSARERLLVAASVAVLAALVTLPLAIAWVLHALAVFFVVERCRPRWLAVMLVTCLLAAMVLLPVLYVGWLGERGRLAREFVAFGTNMALLRLWGHAADRWQGTSPVTPVRRFLLSTMFFPTFVNGPIEATRQLPEPWPAPGLRELHTGLRRIALGVTKLTVTALLFPAGWIDPLAHAATDASGLVLWGWGARLYVWFYLSFSAWSDVAIGLGALTGHVVVENFDAPWRALEPADFWHRWHVSLGLWLRDRVYIPLGGNRRHRAVNVGATFTVSVLWHVWGTLKLLGLGYFPARAWGGFFVWGALNTAGVLLGRPLARAVPTDSAVAHAGLRLATFLFACLCWVPFFLPPSVPFDEALGMLARMLWPIHGS